MRESRNLGFRIQCLGFRVDSRHVVHVGIDYTQAQEACPWNHFGGQIQYMFYMGGDFRKKMGGGGGEEGGCFGSRHKQGFRKYGVSNPDPQISESHGIPDTTFGDTSLAMKSCMKL